jgi:predicted nucleic acid-binding protein
MRLVVADTSPLVYLILIEQINILPQLFDNVILPGAVHTELCHLLAPAAVRIWAEALPSWAEVKPSPEITDDVLRSLGAGERAAIGLALSIHADLVLIDERKGTQVAIDNGLEVSGTLGVLQRAARNGLLNLAESFDRLKATNFRYRQQILDRLLREENPH